MLEIPGRPLCARPTAGTPICGCTGKYSVFAIEQGYQYFDFGRSTQDAGTFKFKRQWGAEPYSHYWYYLLPPGAMPGLNPDNPKYKLVIAIWKKLPVWLTKIIGP